MVGVEDISLQEDLQP